MENQFFTHYKNWEDFQNGMYRMGLERDRDKLVFNAVGLLKAENDFYATLVEMLNDWKIAAKVNMTNNQQNKRAWLGAAACCYKFSTPEYLTRIAWNLLNREDQDKANAIAERVISEYLNKSNESHAQTLFEYQYP
jgi:hypothetical protein